MTNGKTKNELNESTEKTAETELNEKDLFAPDEMTQEMPVDTAVPGKKPAGPKKGIKPAKSGRQTKTKTKPVAKTVSEGGSKIKAVPIGKTSAKKKPAKKKKPSAKKPAAKAEKVSGPEATVSMADDRMILPEVPAAAAAPRKAGRPKGSRNIVVKAITVDATDIPAKRGRKPKTGSAALPVDTEVVSITPAKRGRKPKTAPVNVPVDAVVIAQMPAKRGRKPKITGAAAPADEAEMVRMPAKRGRKPKITSAAAIPADEAATGGIPAKRGRKPKIAVPVFSVDAIKPIRDPVFDGPEGISAGNIEALLQRMTACLEILSKTMETLVLAFKKES